MSYNRLKYITLPKIWWYVSGKFIYDALYSYWWLNIAKRKPLWPDADSAQCEFRWCRYCGKGGADRKVVEGEV